MRHHTKDYIQAIHKVNYLKRRRAKLSTLPEVNSLDEIIFQALNRGFNTLENSSISLSLQILQKMT